MGAFGRTGRGVEEHTAAPAVDVLVGTLGKAFGVNGGYVVANAATIRFLRESSPMYIYSNPITMGEAAAALASLRIVASPEGKQLLEKLRGLTKRFERGLERIGIETIPGEHEKTLEAQIKGFGKAVRNGQLVAVEEGIFGLARAELERYQGLL